MFAIVVSVLTYLRIEALIDILLQRGSGFFEKDLRLTLRPVRYISTDREAGRAFWLADFGGYHEGIGIVCAHCDARSFAFTF